MCFIRLLETMEECSEIYKSYDKRLETFKSWKHDFPKEKLARAGFIYTGEDDIVMCPFCRSEGFRWQAVDDPIADHLKWNPLCQFFDFDDIFFISRPPVYKDKITNASRLVTFKDWPIAMKQTPADLTKAGFFYTGFGDRIKCFHCGVEVKNLLPNDDIQERHASMSSKCLFLKNHTTESTLNCKICLNNVISLAFVPCRHLVSCIDCSIKLENCCICREKICGYFKVFIP